MFRNVRLSEVKQSTRVNKLIKVTEKKSQSLKNPVLDIFTHE